MEDTTQQRTGMNNEYTYYAMGRTSGKSLTRFTYAKDFLKFVNGVERSGIIVDDMKGEKDAD